MPRPPTPDRLRVAHVLPPGAYSGVPIAALSLARALALRGHEVEVWPLHDWSTEDRAVFGPVLDGSGVTVVEHPGTLVRQRAALLAARVVDIVHLHSVFVPQNVKLAKRLRAPYVVSPHGGYAPEALARSALRKRLYGAVAERPYLRRAALAVALTAVEAGELRRYGRGAPVAVVPNGVTTPAAGMDRRAFRAELGLGDADLLAVFTGRLDVFHKGLDHLVRGLVGAPMWRLALVGSGAQGDVDHVRGLARSLGVSERVWMVGPRFGRQFWESLAGADLFVLTSRWEGLPLSLLEALALGVPALVSPAVEARIAVAAEGAGWVAPPDELAERLRALSGLAPEEWAARAAAGRRMAGRYDWSVIAARYEQLYLEVIRDSAPR